MPVNWALGLQQGNAGDAFAQRVQARPGDNRQNMARSAMAALVANPKNERALQALASVDPQAAQQFQQQQQQAAMQDSSSTATTSSRARSSFARCSPRTTRAGSRCFRSRTRRAST
jgi:hypothetical protein